MLLNVQVAHPTTAVIMAHLDALAIARVLGVTKVLKERRFLDSFYERAQNDTVPYIACF